MYRYVQDECIQAILAYPCDIRDDISSHKRGHGGRVVTLSPPTFEARARFPAWPQVGKLVVACHWSAVYSTEP